MRSLSILLLLLAGCGGAPEDPADEREGDAAVVLDAGTDLGFVEDEDDADGGTADEGVPDGAAALPPGVAPHPRVLAPDVDLHVRSGAEAGKSFADAATLWIDKEDKGTETQAFMRFTVGDVGLIARATLHLYVNNAALESLDIKSLDGAAIDAAMTWNTRPTAEGTLVTSIKQTTINQWIEIDVTALAQAGGPLTLALLPRSGDGVGIAASESATHKPKLMLELGAPLPPNAIQPEVDTFVRAGDTAGKVYGSQTYFDVDGDAGAEKHAYLRFRIGAVPAIQRAALRLYLLDGSSNSASVATVADHAFAEDLTWSSKPAAGATIAAIGATARGWVELDLTRHVKPSSTLSLALLPASTNGIRVASRERPFYSPHLLLTTAKASCGDGRCEGGETCRDCKQDCGECPKGCLAGELLPVAGDLHAHTSYSDGQGTPTQAFDHARSRLDFLILTDHHRSITADEWKSCRSAADKADTPGKFVALCGWEISIAPPGGSSLGHSNVFFSAALAALPYVPDRTTYYNKLAACTTCFAQINHPASERFTWSSYAYVAKAGAKLGLQEFNGGGTVADKLGMYAKGLDSGWRLAPTWNSDTHSANWGERAARSGFWLTKIDRAGLEEAMRGRRSFASSDKDARLLLRSGACWPGSELGSASLAPVSVWASDPSDGFDRIVIVGRGNKPLRVIPCGGQKSCAGTTLVQVAEVGYAFAYAVQKDGDHVIAAPVRFSP